MTSTTAELIIDRDCFSEDGKGLRVTKSSFDNLDRFGQDELLDLWVFQNHPNGLGWDDRFQLVGNSMKHELLEDDESFLPEHLRK